MALFDYKNSFFKVLFGSISFLNNIKVLVDFQTAISCTTIYPRTYAGRSWAYSTSSHLNFIFDFCLFYSYFSFIFNWIFKLRIIILILFRDTFKILIILFCLHVSWLLGRYYRTIISSCTTNKRRRWVAIDRVSEVA